VTTAQVELTKSGTPGNYRLDINEVDGTGVPTNTVLASTTIPDASVPAGPSTITGSFSNPAPVSGGQQYALVVTRPGASALQVGARTSDNCPGLLFGSASQPGTFSVVSSAYDLVFNVFVTPAVQDQVPPETTITKGPKDKTKKRSASFEFNSSEAGATFACSLDGGPFEPCTSPKIYEKLKRKKHTFAVVATDAAGNADATPATDDWNVKKKKKKKKH
jgi:hypothetical protein